MKRCSKCGECKPLDNFNRRVDAKDGRKAACKTCMATYREQNRERIVAQNAAAYQKNKSAVLEYYATERGKAIRRRAALRYAQSEHGKAQRRAWYQTEEGRDSARHRKHRRRALLRGRHSERWYGAQIDMRTDGRCAVCGLPVEPGQDRDYHHMIALANGGYDVPDNVVLTHRTCHYPLGASRTRTIRLKLRPKPAMPTAEFLQQREALPV